MTVPRGFSPCLLLSIHLQRVLGTLRSGLEPGSASTARAPAPCSKASWACSPQVQPAPVTSWLPRHWPCPAGGSTCSWPQWPLSKAWPEAISALMAHPLLWLWGGTTAATWGGNPSASPMDVTRDMQWRRLYLGHVRAFGEHLCECLQRSAAALVLEAPLGARRMWSLPTDPPPPSSTPVRGKDRPRMSRGKQALLQGHLGRGLGCT